LQKTSWGKSVSDEKGRLNNRKLEEKNDQKTDTDFMKKRGEVSEDKLA